MVRMLEAERPIIATQHNDGVRAFMDDVPGAAEPLAFLRDMFLERPCSCSKVREAFGDVRHRTVHHSWVDGDELRSTLVDAADEDARRKQARVRRRRGRLLSSPAGARTTDTRHSHSDESGRGRALLCGIGVSRSERRFRHGATAGAATGRKPDSRPERLLMIGSWLMPQMLASAGVGNPLRAAVRLAG
jgi:hypothetical protein